MISDLKTKQGIKGKILIFWVESHFHNVINRRKGYSVVMLTRVSTITMLVLFTTQSILLSTSVELATCPPVGVMGCGPKPRFHISNLVFTSQTSYKQFNARYSSILIISYILFKIKKKIFFLIYWDFSFKIKNIYRERRRIRKSMCTYSQAD